MLFYSYFKTLVGKKVGREDAASLLLHSISHRCHRATVVMRLDTGLLPCDRCSHRMQVTVELKNDLAISGTLHSVDQYLNIKLHNTQVRCPRSVVTTCKCGGDPALWPIIIWHDQEVVRPQGVCMICNCD